MANPFDISQAELDAMPDGPLKTAIKSILSINQTLFTTVGNMPADNVMPYFYGFLNTAANGNAIAANSTAQNNIKISADAAFIATSIRGSSDGDYSMFMRMDASDRQLMNIQMHSSILMGTAERPGWLAKPLLLPANTTISFDISDLSGATNNLYFGLSGFKVYGRRVSG